MSSITHWVRLEATTRAGEFERSLQAGIGDAFWMLARQWQFGEFLGEDAASPVQAAIRLERTAVSRIRLRDAETGEPRVGPIPDAPLEVVVERETVLNGVSVRQRAIESGLHCLQMVAAAIDDAADLRAALRRTYPIPGLTDAERADLDGESARFLDVMAGRAVDGEALRNAVLAAGDVVVPTELGVAEPILGSVKAALTAWAAWYDGRFNEPEGRTTAWIPERMEYSFAVGAPLEDRELVLDAAEYHGGRLDWHAFDVSGETELDGSPQRNAPLVSERWLLPSPIRYPGMPADRFWEFEDRRVHLARYDAGPADISKLLLVEFAMVYGNDWFRVPVDMDLGDLVRIDSLVVMDNFGDETAVKPATQIDNEVFPSPWCMFVMANDPALSRGEASSRAGVRKGPWLFRPPTLAQSVNGGAIEEVVFARDEMANLAWAIERVVEGMAGTPISRAERWLSGNARATNDGSSSGGDEEADARYRLQTTVPEHWIPLVPVKMGTDNASMILRRGRSRLPTGELSPAPKGWVLVPGRKLPVTEEEIPKLLVYEEEIPRSGVVVTRRWEMARWTDGSTWLWLSRRKGPGRGERSSGLQYDIIDT